MSDKPAPRFPKKMMIFSVLAVIALVTPRFFVTEIEDATGYGLDMINVGAIALLTVFFLAWLIWCFCFSNLKWWQRIFLGALIAACPIWIGLNVEFQGGDLDRIVFRWSKRAELKADVATSQGGVDLKTETPQDFAQFLGSNQKGAVQNVTLDVSAFETANVLWKKDVGEGWSGFAARNGFAVTMEQRGDQECVTCYAIDTGDLQWLYQHAARHKDTMNLGHTGPRATPTIHDGKVYAMGAVGNLVCLDGSDGSVVWQKDLNELLGITLGSGEYDGHTFQYESNTSLAWGRSGSPLIVDDTVVVPGGGPDTDKRATLLAFNKDTGAEVWRGGRDMIAYGSPVLATVSGKRQILLTAETNALGFDAATGEQLWSRLRTGQSSQAANTSQVTVISDTQILTSKGYPDGGGELITLKNDGGKLVPEPDWVNGRVLKTKLTSPIVFEGHTYCLSNGFLECARISDGKRIWKQRGRFGHGQMLLVGDKLLLNTERGKLLLIDASADGYKQFGSIDTVRGVCWNVLCLYGSKLLVRSELEAACIELPVK